MNGKNLLENTSLKNYAKLCEEGSYKGPNNKMQSPSDLHTYFWIYKKVLQNIPESPQTSGSGVLRDGD